MYDGKDDPFLYVADKKHNLIFKNIAEATEQLITTTNYVPKREEAEALKKAKGTVKIRISELELTADGKEYGYFEIDTSNYKTSNKARMAVTQAVYGKEKELDANMKMLRGEGLTKTRAYVLLPEYTKQKIEELKGPIVRASRLGRVDGGSGFDAVGRDVDDADFGLRGVRKISAEGAAQKVEVNPYVTAYETLAKDPTAAAKAITPLYQAVIANILARSLGQKA